jgi:hypothetical protein
VTGFDPGAVQATVLARILAWRVDLPLTLRDPLDEMLKRRRYLLVDDVPDYFGPRTTPLLSMPLWLTAALRAQGHTIPDAAAIDAAEAALTGYFLIRVIDDHVDEGTGDSGAVVLLASALQARMTAVFARVAPRGSPFWPLLDEVFTTAGDAMLRERALLTGPGIQSEAEFTALLGRYDPLLLAGAALLAAADDWRLLDPLRAIVRHLGASVQRFNDAFDAPADLAAGRRTWAVCRCAPDSDPDRLHDRLNGGGLDQLVDEAIADAARARDVAAAAGLPHAAEAMAARIADLDATRAAYFEQLTDAVLNEWMLG